MTRLLLALLLLAAPALAQQPQPLPRDLPQQRGPMFEREWQGEIGGPNQAATVIATTEAEWTALWRRARMNQSPPFTPGRDVGVAVFLGQRRSAGYAVRFETANLGADTVRVTWREVAPAPGGAGLPIVTTPWAIINVEARGRRVVLEQGR